MRYPKTIEKGDAMKSGVKMIMKAFYRGEKNIVKAQELGARLERNSETVRGYINELRKEGVPICSSKHGFYYAETETDIMATINHLEGRALDMMECADALRKALKNKPLR